MSHLLLHFNIRIDFKIGIDGHVSLDLNWWWKWRYGKTTENPVKKIRNYTHTSTHTYIYIYIYIYIYNR